MVWHIRLQNMARVIRDTPVERDLQYSDRQRSLIDMKILIKTIPTTLFC